MRYLLKEGNLRRLLETTKASQIPISKMIKTSHSMDTIDWFIITNT